MFEPLTFNSPSLRTNINDVFLDDYHWKNGDLKVSLLAANVDHALNLSFNEILGLTYMDECYGSEGGQVVRETKINASTVLSRSLDSETLDYVRKTAGEPFNNAFDEHAYFVVRTRHESLYFLASNFVEMNVLPLDQTVEMTNAH